jgi:hypothetical protein
MPRTTEDTKYVLVTPPAAIVDNASFTTAAVDTKGFAHCQFLVMIGATDIALTALKIQESDASGSGYADVTGLIYGTSTDPSGATVALPSATDDNKVYAFDVHCGRGRKRYLDAVVTIGDGTVGGFVTVLAILSKAAKRPSTNAEKGRGGTLKA